MKILSNLLKDANDEYLVKITSYINNANPIVDRIMEDDSVEGVIMTNKAGSPILTNVSLVTACNYGLKFNGFCNMVQTYMQELVEHFASIVKRMKKRVCHTTGCILNPLSDCQSEILIWEQYRPVIEIDHCTCFKANYFLIKSLQHFCIFRRPQDLFDKVLAIRVKTSKKEILIAPDKEFNIFVLQQGRIKMNNKHPFQKQNDDDDYDFLHNYE